MTNNINKSFCKERVFLTKLQAFMCSFTKNIFLHIIFKEFVLFSKIPITRNFMVPGGTFTKACSLAQSQSPLRKRTSYHVETSQIICTVNYLVYIRLYSKLYLNRLFMKIKRSKQSFILIGNLLLGVISMSLGILAIK